MHFAISAYSAISSRTVAHNPTSFGKTRSRVSEATTHTIASSLSISIRPTKALLHEKILNTSTIQQQESRS